MPPLNHPRPALTLGHLAALLALGVALVAANVPGAAGSGSRPADSAHPHPVRLTAAPTAAPRPHAVPCVDLPISSALIDATSCWQLGPTMMAMAGTSLAHPGSGAVAVINGQRQGVQVVPGSGRLRIVSADLAGACTVGPGARYRSLDLADARLGPVSTGGCAAGPPSGSAIPTANLLSDQMPASSAVSTLAYDVPPPASPSYYEWQAYDTGACTGTPSSACPLYQQGQATYPPSPSGVVVLDFGAPCYVPSGVNEYGTEMFGGPTPPVCTPDATIESLVGAWIAGYESDHGAGTTPLTLAIGTSNSLNAVDSLDSAQLSASGMLWYQQVVGRVPTSGLGAPITVWGASDMEQSSSGNWYGGAATVAWVQGYDSASPARYTCSQSQVGFLADYGDDVLGGSGSTGAWPSADQWSVSQVYQVAWSIPVACPIPEIYYSDMATEWQALSQWGIQNSPAGAILFTGVMTTSGSNTPTQGWEQLEQATAQSPPIPTLTNIGSALQGQPPTVTSVSPTQGPASGGTTVTISGANFLGTQAVYFGANASPNFKVVAADQVQATVPAGSPGFVDVEVETALGASPSQGTDGFLYQDAATYHPVVPARIEDTRPGSGLPGSGLAPGSHGVLEVQVAGRGGVPATGVSAVVINLTITEPTEGGYVTAYPAGIPTPLVSTIDFSPGATKANLALVTLGRNGEISIYNAIGTTQVVIDVEGWYATPAQYSGGALLNPLYPQRIVDTRPDSGHPYSGDTLGPGQSLTVQVAGVGGVPASGVVAVAMNLTETGATRDSYLTVYPAGAAQPSTSNLNFGAGQTAANQLIMKLGSGGKVTIYNDQGSVNVILDVAGWLGSSGSALNTLVPARAVDTRSGSGSLYAGHPLAPKQVLTIDFAGLAGLPASGIGTLAVNVTVTDGEAPGALSIGPGGAPVPQTSELDWMTGQTTENLAIMQTGADGSLTFYNRSAGSVELVVDVYGWFA